jgi:pimeloyl-ACP methyl ester carboxylesterase
MLVTLWILSLAAAVLFAGILYQLLGSRRDRRRFTTDGRWVRAGNGCDLFLFELGVGEPTVVFEAGIGATHLNWRQVQESIAEHTSTVSYDRAGLGWSGRCRSARTPLNAATELHQMLESAGIKPPFILVGHSFGGLVMRRYALLFPQDVAGVVLIDPMRCEEWPPLNPSKQTQVDLGKRLIGYAQPIVYCGLARLLVRFLFGRPGNLSDHIARAAGPNPRHVLTRIKTEVRKMPPAVWPAIAAHWSRPGFYAGLRSHIGSITGTVEEMHAADAISAAIPVTVLTPGNAVPLSPEQLVGIGGDVRQQIAKKSAHWIHLDEPGLTIDAICAMVSAAVSESVAAD